MDVVDVVAILVGPFAALAAVVVIERLQLIRRRDEASREETLEAYRQQLIGSKEVMDAALAAGFTVDAPGTRGGLETKEVGRDRPPPRRPPSTPPIPPPPPPSPPEPWLSKHGATLIVGLFALVGPILTYVVATEGGVPDCVGYLEKLVAFDEKYKDANLTELVGVSAGGLSELEAECGRPARFIEDAG